MTQLRRARAGTDLSVGQLTIAELQHEIGRRLEGLQERRAKLEAEIAEIDSQLESVDDLQEIAKIPDGEPRLRADGPRTP